MQHRIRASSSQRFFRAFYQALLSGEPVSDCVNRGRVALTQRTSVQLQTTDSRGDTAIVLQDWFVPVLYQAVPDQPLVRRVASARSGLAQDKAAPDLPPAAPLFMGRARDLLPRFINTSGVRCRL